MRVSLASHGGSNLPSLKLTDTTIYDLYRPVMRVTRRRRIRRFWRDCRVGENTSVIDIGGTMYFWNLARSLGLAMPRQIVIVNPRVKATSIHPTGAILMNGDARDLRGFQARQFDIAFSNSVIEHLGDREGQQKMASELRRVAKIYWVQTPHPHFPVEPHYLFPAIHWFPKHWQRRIVPLTLWNILKKPSDAEISARIAELRLVGQRELGELFPDARLTVERFLGWPKSLIATNSEV
jgi:hypothetical protein